MVSIQNTLAAFVKKYSGPIQEEWQKEQLSASASGAGALSDSDVRQDTRDFFKQFSAGIAAEEMNVDGAVWKATRDNLAAVSRSRAIAGFSPTETATFIFSLKKPVFEFLRKEYSDRPDLYASLVWELTTLLDRFGLMTIEFYQKTREEVIRRQQEEMLELSTPVVKLWDGILALPMIGTLDSARTQVVMETLLQRIVETGSEVAILDITGVPHVDTLTAQHLLKTVTAARLMGADCIISGIRPQIAQTIVHLGVNLGDVTTKASLADAFAVALRRTGKAVGKISSARFDSSFKSKADSV